MSKHIKIGLIGRVSSGKSSFTNGLCGGFISNTSLLRETFAPLYYQFGNSGKEQLITVLGNKLENDRTPDDVREKIKEMNENEMAFIKRYCDDDNELPLRYGINPFSITDMAGIDDADDNENKFFKVFESLYTEFNLIIYMTDASHAFLNKSEVDTFLKIKKLINDWNKTSEYIELIVVINKYDDTGDEDLDKIYKKVITNNYIDKQNIFRVSSHKLMIDNIKRHGLQLYVPNAQAAKEFSRILKNTGECAIKNIVPKSHVTLNDDLDDDFNDVGFRGVVDGDIDNLITYLRNTNKTLADKSIKSHTDYNNNILEACLGLYGPQPKTDMSKADMPHPKADMPNAAKDILPSNATKDMPNTITDTPYYATYTNLMSKLNTTKYPLTPLLQKYFGEIITCIVTKPVRMRLLENIIQHIKENDDAIEYYKLLLPWILKNLDNIAFETLYLIVYCIMNTKSSYKMSGAKSPYNGPVLQYDRSINRMPYNRIIEEDPRMSYNRIVDDVPMTPYYTAHEEYDMIPEEKPNISNEEYSMVPELASKIHIIFATKILPNPLFYSSTSLNIWSIDNKKSYSHFECSDVNNHKYYSHYINNIRRNKEYGYEYLLSLSAFSVEEMIYLHLANEIDYSKLNQFPMIRRNIIWIIHQGRPYPFKNEWRELLRPYWDKKHKDYELKKGDILG